MCVEIKIFYSPNYPITLNVSANIICYLWLLVFRHWNLETSRPTYVDMNIWNNIEAVTKKSFKSESSNSSFADQWEVNNTKINCWLNNTHYQLYDPAAWCLSIQITNIMENTLPKTSVNPKNIELHIVWLDIEQQLISKALFRKFPDRG